MRRLAYISSHASIRTAGVRDAQGPARFEYFSGRRCFDRRERVHSDDQLLDVGSLALSIYTYGLDAQITSDIDIGDVRVGRRVRSCQGLFRDLHVSQLSATTAYAEAPGEYEGTQRVASRRESWMQADLVARKLVHRFRDDAAVETVSALVHTRIQP
jgi:hypothetical protein